MTMNKTSLEQKLDRIIALLEEAEKDREMVKRIFSRMEDDYWQNVRNVIHAEILPRGLLKGTGPSSSPSSSPSAASSVTDLKRHKTRFPNNVIFDALRE